MLWCWGSALVHAADRCKPKSSCLLRPFATKDAAATHVNVPLALALHSACVADPFSAYVCCLHAPCVLPCSLLLTQAIEEFVDIDSEEQIDVSITTEPEVGTVYCVAVPIKRVKPEARIALNEEGDIEGLTFEYDPEDPNSDPSSQFPFGT